MSAPSTAIQKHGSRRLSGRFIRGHVGGVPRILSSSDTPVQTLGEREFFHRILPAYRNGSKIDWRGMRGAFNLAFATQVPSQPISTPADRSNMIFSKSIKHLKAYYQEFDRSHRSWENRAFNTAQSSIPPPLPSDDQTQANIVDMFKKAQQKRKASEVIDSPQVCCILVRNYDC